MKINIKEFNSLTREPNEIQEFEGNEVAVYFMNELEEGAYNAAGRFAIWSSDGKQYKLLINQKYYEYGVISHFYSAPVNKRWLEYIEKVSKMQRKLLFTLMLPVMIGYLVVAVLSLIFFQDYAIYILIGLMAVIFGVNVFQNRIIKRNMDEENEEVHGDIQKIIGVDIYDQVANDQIKFREMLNPHYQEETSEIEPEVEQIEESEKGEIDEE